MSHRFITFTLIFLAATSCVAQQSVTGQITDRRDGSHEDSVQVELVGASLPPQKLPARRFIHDTLFSLVTIQYTDRSGNFGIDSLQPGVYYLLCSKWMDSIGERTTYTRVVITAEPHDSVRIRIPEFCKYDTENNRSGICPLCQSKSFVIPVAYGEPPDAWFEQADRNEIYLGGCEMDDYCQARWYCRTHKLLF